jgi:Protein of Unknown function (DUF2784)
MPTQSVAEGIPTRSVGTSEHNEDANFPTGNHPMNAYRILADVIVLLHFAYVGFVVFGLIAIVIGLAMRKGWARNFWFRTVHLTMILIVVAEAWAGITCPLTTWENQLRMAGGGKAEVLGFIERWLHAVMFFRLPPWVFAVGYSGFGLIVLATFLLGPPTWPKRRDPSASSPPVDH